MNKDSDIGLLKRVVRRFRTDEAGGATVEAVLWLPTFIFFFIMIADVSFVFHRQSQVLTVLQDGNRALSVGRLSSTEEVVDFVTERLANLTDNAIVDSFITGGVVTTNVLVPINDLVAVGSFEFLSNYNVGVASQQFIEY